MAGVLNPAISISMFVDSVKRGSILFKSMKENVRIPETGAEKLTMYQCLCYVLLTETSSCQVPFASLIVLNTTKYEYYFKMSSLSLHFLVDLFVQGRNYQMAAK